MGSPIFDSTFGTGRFKSEEPMTTDPTTSPSPEPQDVRVTDAMVEAAMNAYDDPGGFRKTDFECMRAALYAALAQSDAEPVERVSELKRQLVEARKLLGENFERRDENGHQ